MSAQTKVKSEVVARCVPRQDGGYMIVTRNGSAGSSASEIPAGAWVTIRDGLAVRSSQ
jgi:hypothetical protein